MNNTQKINIQTFKTYHRIPSIGYGINDLLAFTGDTSIELFKNFPIFDYQNILTECTYIEDIKPDMKIDFLTKKFQHTSYNQLKPYILENPNTNFILSHWSKRYNEKDLQNYFQNNCNVKNIIPFI